MVLRWFCGRVCHPSCNQSHYNARAYRGINGLGSGGGEGGIRTPGGVTPTPHFECGAFDHSATSPRGVVALAAPSVGRAYGIATYGLQHLASAFLDGGPVGLSRRPGHLPLECRKDGCGPFSRGGRAAIDDEIVALAGVNCLLPAAHRIRHPVAGDIVAATWVGIAACHDHLDRASYTHPEYVQPGEARQRVGVNPERT